MADRVDDSLAEYSFKIVVLGDKSVGKSSILTRLQLDKFDLTPSHTIGVGFSTHRMNIGPEAVQLNLWDTAGEERFKSLTQQYYRNADAAIIVFDLTSKKTFESVKNYWIHAFHQAVGSDEYIVFVGNKRDLTEEREVETETIEELASLYCCSSWETSAKESTNVTEVFHRMAGNLIEKTKQLQSIESGPASLSLPYSINSYEPRTYYTSYCCWST